MQNTLFAMQWGTLLGIVFKAVTTGRQIGSDDRIWHVCAIACEDEISIRAILCVTMIEWTAPEDFVWWRKILCTIRFLVAIQNSMMWLCWVRQMYK
jgi:hypothetical protein